MCTICQSTRPYDPSCIYSEFSSGTATANSQPTYSTDQIAQFLNEGYWGASYAFDVAPGGELSVNITQLTSDGKVLARRALDAWSDVTGIGFVEVSGGADISFDDESSGAYASFSYTGNTIQNASINIHKAWAGGGNAIEGYHFQTYLHEIGHALGLGHGGSYNGSATYGVNNHYANDSWQMSLMSYFSQTENTSTNASFAYTITPMMADILAIQELYGTPTTRAGDTVYGERGNTGTYLDNWLGSANGAALTIYDSGGHDRLDLRSQTYSQRIDLTPESFSDVQGKVGNLAIARDTVIEEVWTGNGHDYVKGNDAANKLVLRGGNDVGIGGAGKDTIHGGSGRDQLWGGSEADVLVGGHGHDRLTGDDGADYLSGGRGYDVLVGGEGDDELLGHGERDYLNGGAGHDQLQGGNGHDRMYGGTGSDFLNGARHNDQLFGGDGTDVLWGSHGNDRLFGQADADTLQGGTGRDVLGGGSGADKLLGGGGRDWLLGGTGDDALWGGSGGDVFRFADGCGSDTVHDFTINAAREIVDLQNVSSITSWSDLKSNHVSMIGGDCVIDAGGGDLITLAGINISELSAGDFVF